MEKILITISFIVLGSTSVVAQTILDHKDKIVVEKLSQLNSYARETNLSISPDGKYLYFMSDRGGQVWSTYSGTYKGKERYDGDIWYSTKVGDTWRRPTCLGLAVNTSSGEDEPMVSQDGQYVVFQSWKYNWKVTGGPYYRAELNGSRFTNSKGLGGGINKFILTEYIKAGNTYATDGAAMSPDGKTFLLCCGRDYDGRMDIYISRKVNGKWTYMKKLPISTAGDERSVFIAGDGKTVYFASDGYKGYGGLDVYKTTLNEDGTCGEVINIGKPFNTSADDYGFIITADGNEGYFVREGDIYYANTKEADPRLKPGVTILISGTIKDQNGNPLQYYLELDDVANGQEISTSKSNSGTGEFLFSTSDVTAKYRIRDDNHKYIDTTFSVKIKDGVGKKHIDIVIRIPDETVTTAQTHEKSIMVNFEHDRSVLDEEDRKQLDDIVSITHSSIEYEISITGHTDVKGSNEYNKKLGLKRATAMKEYLVAQGVDPDKITVSSSGESKLLEKDANSPAAERNRRAELTIKYSN
ncbi:MAG: PD40 domain-containing protein [Crocinitomicaceae bacterium]|nr:PD40 domain-containing protein [Crocinitomicaceae bacterium]